MARNRAMALRVGVALLSWCAAVAVSQAVLGSDITRSSRELERRIELRFRPPEPPPPAPAERSHEGESYESWELVGV